MSMSDALALMSKLASSIGGASSQSAMSAALKSDSGAKGSTYVLKIDSGTYKDWYVVKAQPVDPTTNKYGNPQIINSKDDTNTTPPKGFKSEAEAITYRNTSGENPARLMQYKYNETDISTVSPLELFHYDPRAEEGVNKMADGVSGTSIEGGLSKVCMDKRTEVIAQERTPTAADYLDAIKTKMFNFLP